MTRASYERMVHEWMFSALDTARGDVEAHKLFDDTVEKEYSELQKKEK